MKHDELRSWFKLSKLELSPKMAGDLLDRFGSPEAIFAARKSELKSVETLSDRALEKLTGAEPAGIDEGLESLEKQSIDMVTLLDADYPSALKQIHDPPIALYVRGELRESDRFSIGIVGSRRATVYGNAMTEKIAEGLAARGLTIVSGGARGIDASAHKGALSASGRTIAVLGCGIDVPYPSEHKGLFNEISKTGAVISEFPPGTTPEGWRFPTRNRIISGLSIGVLVVQAPSDSGALITARFAAEHGRDIYALPGNVDDIRNEGCHALIRDGAVLVTSAEDIMQEVGLDAGESQSSQLNLVFNSLEDEERTLVELLSLQPKHVDALIKESGLPAPKATGTLTLLEMKGLVKRVPGNAYVRAL